MAREMEWVKRRGAGERQGRGRGRGAQGDWRVQRDRDYGVREGEEREGAAARGVADAASFGRYPSNSPSLPGLLHPPFRCW